MKELSEQDSLRVRWAETQITALLQQRAGIDRRIAEFRAFVAMLQESDLAIRNRSAHMESPRLSNLVVDVLRDYSREMTPGEVADEVERRGFKATGKVGLRELVGIELPRQARTARSGIMRIAEGRYVFNMGDLEESSFKSPAFMQYFVRPEDIK